MTQSALRGWGFFCFLNCHEDRSPAAAENWVQVQFCRFLVHLDDLLVLFLTRYWVEVVEGTFFLCRCRPPYGDYIIKAARIRVSFIVDLPIFGLADD